MKWALTLALFTATGIAAPVVPVNPSDDISVYKLRISTRNKDLNGKYLSNNGTALGIFKSITPAPPVQVYPVTDKKTGLVELHTYPPGKVDQVIALVGDRNGLLTFSNVVSPATVTFPTNTTCDWKSFRLGGGNSPAPGRPGNTVTYEAAAGGWAAFPSQNPGDWVLTFKNSNAVTLANYMPVDVVYEPAHDVDREDGIVTIQ